MRISTFKMLAIWVAALTALALGTYALAGFEFAITSTMIWITWMTEIEAIGQSMKAEGRSGSISIAMEFLMASVATLVAYWLGKIQKDLGLYIIGGLHALFFLLLSFDVFRSRRAIAQRKIASEQSGG